jgi:hypothetical protein
MSDPRRYVHYVIYETATGTLRAAGSCRADEVERQSIATDAALLITPFKPDPNSYRVVDGALVAIEGQS